MTTTRPSGLSVNHIDRSVRPQDDFFRFANGGWLDSTDIPSDRARYGTFDILRERSEERVRDIVEAVAAIEEPAAPGSPEQQVGDLYRSFMDVERIEERGLEPMGPFLQQVAAVSDVESLVRTSAKLSRSGAGGLFHAFVGPDEASPDEYVTFLEQGGLGLPDESYYRDERYAAERDAYVAHLQRMFEFAGIPDAADKASRVMALETRIAGSHWDTVANRDAVKTFNPHAIEELAALAPSFPWESWLSGIGADGRIDRVIVRQPSFIAALGDSLSEVSLEDWKAWMTWQVINAFAPLLPEQFVDADFDFYGRTLSGQPEIKQRWKRGVQAVEEAVGESVGKLYVERWFPPEAKARMKELVANLVEAFRRSFESLEWMSPATRAEAADKLAKFTPKIGYPDVWRDYSSLTIDPDDLLGNLVRAREFEFDRNLAKLGQPIDRTEWFMLPQHVNAYYMPSMNEIVFPAAILQPPFFDAEGDDAANYGGIGAVIGHEVGHGFDDQGSRYDGSGALRDWWTGEDRQRFDELSGRLIIQFDAFVPNGLDPKHHVNGALTVGENIGDLGGLQIGFAAYRIATEQSGMPEIDGFTGPQRFFLGWAQVWKGKSRDAEAIRLLAIDPHSPQEFRAGAVRNVSEFHEAFDVQPGDEMWLEPQERVQIF